MDDATAKLLSEKSISMINAKLEQLKSVEQQLENLKKYMLTNNFIDVIKKVQFTKNSSTNNSSELNAVINLNTCDSDNESHHSSSSDDNDDESPESNEPTESDEIYNSIPKFDVNRPIYSSRLCRLFPKEKDQLFWCFYVIHFNVYQYETVPNYFVAENEFKIKTIELANENSLILKQNKISKQIFESCVQSHLTPPALNAYCFLYKANVFFIHKNSYFEMYYGENKPTFIIEKHDNGYSLQLPVIKTTTKTFSRHQIYINEFKEKGYKLDNIEKPLKPFSSYSLPDLTNIASKFDISLTNNENKKKTKKELYDEILTKF